LIVTGNSDFGRALVKALGLEGKRVRALTIRSAVDEVVTVTAEMIVIDREAGDVATLLKHYRLVEREAEETADVTDLDSTSKVRIVR
jgi:NAD(P)-dependent dehydrogenase (short-subunit alcohol dehydrogenase family)